MIPALCQPMRVHGVSGRASLKQPTTDEGGLALQPVLTCHPNQGLAKYQRLQVSCVAAPTIAGNNRIGEFGGKKYPDTVAIHMHSAKPTQKRSPQAPQPNSRLRFASTHPTPKRTSRSHACV